jgi:hypothetical protein
MESLELIQYFRKAIILPGSIIVLGFIIYGISDALFGNEYQSEWMTKEGAIFTTIILVVLNTIFISLLATPLFLNNNPKVRSNLIISTLTWFLSPGIWIGYLLTKHYNYLTNFSHKFDSESVFVLSNTIPFVIGLAWTFIKFRKDLKIQKSRLQK